MEREYSYFELCNICNLYDLWSEGEIDTDTMSKNLLNAYSLFNGVLDCPPVWEMFNNCNRELLMEEEDLAAYNALPDKVTLYRGQNCELLNGISWTLDVEIARKFANMCDCEEVGILELEIDKKDIIAYTNCRNEQECIVFKSDDADWLCSWSK